MGLKLEIGRSQDGTKVRKTYARNNLKRGTKSKKTKKITLTYRDSKSKHPRKPITDIIYPQYKSLKISKLDLLDT